MNAYEQEALSILSNKFQHDINNEINLDIKITSLELSSLSYIELIVDLEEKFNIVFDNEKLTYDAFKTIRDLVEYIEIKSNNVC